MQDVPALAEVATEDSSCDRMQPLSTWRTDSMGDRIRYYVGNEAPGSWQVCMKLNEEKVPEALEQEWEKCRAELESWMERAEEALATGNANAGTPLPYGWRAAPYFNLHYILPRLFALGQVTVEQAERVMEQGRQAYILSLRLKVQSLLYWEREGACNLDPQLFECDEAVRDVRTAGLDERTIPEYQAYADCLARQEALREERSRRAQENSVPHREVKPLGRMTA